MREELGLAITLLVLGCAKPQMANTCPESKDLRCMTEVKCERDETRQCMKCSCAPPPYDFEGNTRAPSAGPPD